MRYSNNRGRCKCQNGYALCVCVRVFKEKMLLLCSNKVWENIE